MQEWVIKNGLQVLLLAIGSCVAFALLSYKVDAQAAEMKQNQERTDVRIQSVEKKVSEYPSKDWFELKFQTVDDRFDRLEGSN